MSDLIRRSDVLELQRYSFGVSMLNSEEYIKVSDVDNILTAYDIDRVVEELEENASRYTKKYVTPYGTNGYRDTKAISIHKAIEIVKQEAEKFGTDINVVSNGCKFTEDDYKANEMAIQTLEKQIPKKPDFTADKEFALCPCCNGKGLFDKQKYCDNCGQKLDWEDDDE